MEATTMTAIAERSGSSIGALYNYFPDKQAVALTLLGQYARGDGRAMEAIDSAGRETYSSRVRESFYRTDH